MGKRGEINPKLGITDGKMNSELKSSLRQLWRNTSRKIFIRSVRRKDINPATGRGWFVVDCSDCSRVMGVTQKAKRTKKDGSLEKRERSVFEIDHIDGITPMQNPSEALHKYYHDLMYGEMRVLCVECHKKRTFK
jgi:hypothetical protein